MRLDDKDLDANNGSSSSNIKLQSDGVLSHGGLSQKHSDSSTANASNNILSIVKTQPIVSKFFMYINIL